MPKPSSKRKSPEPEGEEDEIDFVRHVKSAAQPAIDFADATRMAARILRSIGSKKGGPASARKLSAKRRAEIAKNAATRGAKKSD